MGAKHCAATLTAPAGVYNSKIKMPFSAYLNGIKAAASLFPFWQMPTSVNTPSG
jgi:hypothetical protein